MGSWNRFWISAPLKDNGSMAISKRAALLTGFGVIITLLVLSTVMAYRIQAIFSQRSAEIHHRYVEQQELLTKLRRVIYMTGATVRDYLINPSPDHKDVFSAQIAALQQDGNKYLGDLRARADRAHTVAALDVIFDDVWRKLASTVVEEWPAQQKYTFVQEELITRLDTAARVLRELERANRGSLNESEEDFQETRTAATQRLLLILGAGLVLGCLVAYFSLRYADLLERQAADRFQEVSEAKLELERLSARLMDIQEEERRRLSRELHDEIVQNLAVLKMDITQTQALTSARVPEARETLSRARALAERTVRAVRDISLLLRPSLLDDLGLGPALQWQTEDFTRRTSVSCEFIEGEVNIALSDAVKTCVYRVTQEALRNCEKHSKATHVRVRLAQSDTEVLVEIEDNGKGFAGGTSVRQPPGHLGLLGMRERAVSAGGHLEAVSAPGRGTKIVLTVPVASAITQQMEVETYA